MKITDTTMLTNFNEQLNRYYDLFKVKYSNGKIGLICQTEISY